jgi:hypothetical protein
LAVLAQSNIEVRTVQSARIEVLEGTVRELDFATDRRLNDADLALRSKSPDP